MRAYLVLAGLLIAMQAAHAAPSISVRSDWSASVDPFYNPIVPDGLGISCYGEAASNGGLGCSGSAFINQLVTAIAHLSATTSGGVIFSNTTDSYLNGYLIVSTSFSAFNPGGPAVGVRIDDATHEGARFSSSVSGRGAGDFHSCSIGTYGNSGTIFTPTSCGVSSPDSSQSSFGFDLSTLAPRSSMQLPYELSIVGDFFLPADPLDGQDSSVPEPATALLMLSGLIGLGFAARRKIARRP